MRELIRRIRMSLRTPKLSIAGLLLSCVLASSPIVAYASKADNYFRDAEQYAAKGDIASAMIQLKNALKSDPTHLQSRLALGEIQLRMNDAPSAAKEFGRARDLGAPKSQWMLGYVRAQMLQRDFRAAADAVDVDDSLTPADQAELLALRGNSLLVLNETAAAIADFDAALAKQPGNPSAGLGKARILVGENDTAAAIDLLNQVLTVHPRHYESLVTRGNLLRGMQQLDAAGADFATAIEVSPNDPRGHVGAAFAHVASADLPAAKQNLADLRRLAKGLPAINYLQALVSFQERDLDRAVEELQLLLRAAPDNIQAQMFYGVVSYARGEYTIADDYLTRAHANMPDNMQVTKLLAAARVKLKQPERAVEVLEEVVSLDSTDAQLLALMGNALLQTGDNNLGAQYIEKAVAIDPDQAMLRTQLAVGKMDSGDTAGAITELESAVALGQDVLQADVLLVLGYLNKGQFENALDASVALEQRMADSPIPYNLTGLAYLSQRQFDQAKARFQLALEKDPAFVVGNMTLARTALMQRDVEAAEAAYRAALKQDARHVGAMMGMSALARVQGREDEVRQWLERAHNANPTALQPILALAEDYLRTNEALKAGSVLSGLSNEQAEVPAVLRLKGMAQLQTGDYPSAVYSLRKLTEKTPESIEAWFQLARAEAAAGNTRASRESFQKAIELDVDFKVPIVWVGLAELDLRERRFQEALELGKRIAANQPDQVYGYDIQASAYRKLGMHARALAAAQSALKAYRDSNRVNRLASQLTSVGRTNDAIAVLNDWLQESPQDVPSLARLGMLHQSQGEVDAALSSYEKALALTPDDAVLLNNMAWLYLERNRNRAVDLATRAYELAPSRAEIVDTYGWVLLNSGRQRDGLAALQQALVIDPNNAEIALHVAEGLTQVGRGREALPLLERVIREHPNSAYSESAKALLNRLRG
jgi:putative PEP-CTERM system TPR-repeat lipoprotein